MVSFTLLEASVIMIIVNTSLTIVAYDSHLQTLYVYSTGHWCRAVLSMSHSSRKFFIILLFCQLGILPTDCFINWLSVNHFVSYLFCQLSFFKWSFFNWSFRPLVFWSIRHFINGLLCA